MKKLLTAIASVVAISAPAQADPITYRALDASPLTQAVRSTGTRVLYDTHRCETDKVYGYYKPSTDLMVLCVKNHGTDYSELGDTLRHESIHVAQACNGGPILTWNQIAKYSNNRILSIVQRYPAKHQHYEYEAFTAAALMNNQQVAKIVNDFCF